MSSSAVKDIRGRLWENSFRPVAVYSYDATHWSGKPIDNAGKRPKGDDWPQRARQNPPEATVAEPTKDALNTGILCDGLIAIDIDIDDAALVAQIVGAAQQLMGAAPKRIRADSSRVLILYRAAKGEPKKRSVIGKHGKIESLGSGQMFVAYGNHPTGTAYLWPDGGPDSFQRELLPPVSQDVLSAFLSASASLIGADAPQEPCRTPEPAVSRTEPTERERAYAETALADECEALAAMKPGEGRNAALNRAAHSVGTMVGAGWIDPESAAQALWDATEANGYRAKDGDRAALTTLQSGLDSGMAKPRDPLPTCEVPQFVRDSVANILAAHKAKQHVTATAPPSKRAVSVVQGYDIQAQPISWLWQGYLPLGKLSLLAGAGGTGKSTIAFNLAATITNGGLWPDGSPCRIAGNVLIWSSEDDAADTIKPRLMAVGANDRRYGVIKGIVDEQGASCPFDAARDMDALREAVNRIGGISLLIIDPILSAVLGDMHKANDVRRSLQTIVDFAAEMNCAVLGISHFAKGTAGRNSAERVIGSQAFAALARMVLVAAKEEESNRRVFTRAKSNNSVDTGGFSYGIEALQLDGGIEATRVIWGEALEGSSRAILAEVESEASEDASQLGTAKRFLLEMLRNGSRCVERIAGTCPRRIRRFSQYPSQSAKGFGNSSN